jgi:hypothetical protein
MELPKAVAAVTEVETNNDCKGSPHQLNGFLVQEGRESSSAFERRREYPTLMIANTGVPKRRVKHESSSGFL